MAKLLLNCVALITGAGHGLGKAYAEEIAKHGAIVVICDNGHDSEGKSLALEVAENINRDGGKAIYYDCSVNDQEQINYMIDDIIQQFGRIDILIHSAGVSISKKLELYSTEEVEAIMSVHLNTVFDMLSVIIPHMKKRRYGRIILVTSTVGMLGLKNSVPYAAAKMGIWGLTRSINKEIEEEGILCNAIAPLAVTTDENYTNDAEYNNKYTTNRVSPFVVALCSEKMNIGGRIYQIAGGNISRIEVCESKGVTFSDKDINVDTILAKMEQVDNMENSVVLSSLEQAGRILFKKVRNVRRNYA